MKRTIKISQRKKNEIRTRMFFFVFQSGSKKQSNAGKFFFLRLLAQQNTHKLRLIKTYDALHHTCVCVIHCVCAPKVECFRNVVFSRAQMITSEMQLNGLNNL